MSTDTKFNELTENKIEKSLRNSKAFKLALDRATKGEFDEDISDATGKNFLKVTEVFTLRKKFILESAEYRYQLCKEVFYIENPGKKYFDTVSPKVYRRIALQHESYEKKAADIVAKEMGIQLVEG